MPTNFSSCAPAMAMRLIMRRRCIRSVPALSFPGNPASGSWAVYGLGTENQNLPAFVVMTDGAMKSGPQGYGAGYLPAVYQGTMFRGGQYPVLDLATPEGVSSERTADHARLH